MSTACIVKHLEERSFKFPFKQGRFLLMILVLIFVDICGGCVAVLLHCNSQEHFEMEPLNGTPPHLLLVVRRGLKPEGKSEVLGMLMDEAERAARPNGNDSSHCSFWAGEYAPKPSKTLVMHGHTVLHAVVGFERKSTEWNEKAVTKNHTKNDTDSLISKIKGTTTLCQENLTCSGAAGGWKKSLTWAVGWCWMPYLAI